MSRDTGQLPLNSRHDEPVQEYEGPNNNTNKVEFTVPVDKTLFIEMWHIAIAEGDGYIIELQNDTVGVASIGGGEGKEGGESMLSPQFNPFGPFDAGSEVRLHREEGTSAKPWSGGFVGYLE